MTLKYILKNLYTFNSHLERVITENTEALILIVFHLAT
jgi:hypothetical protein